MHTNGSRECKGVTHVDDVVIKGDSFKGVSASAGKLPGGAAKEHLDHGDPAVAVGGNAVNQNAGCCTSFCNALNDLCNKASECLASIV